MDNVCNHRVLLWDALQKTSGLVVEFGSGHGSTPYLKEYCEHHDREFRSFDSDKGWAKKTGATVVTDWANITLEKIDVLFIDQAPGERRKFDIVKFKDHATIIVAHDTEPTGGGDYQMRQHFNLFKYKLEVKTEGAWATMLSNHIDFTDCIGNKFDEYVISE